MAGTLDPIKEYIETGRALKIMAQVHSDLAASRLEQIRKQIERNRTFAAELALAFREVKTATRKYKVPNKDKKDKINVLLFSNHGFFIGMESEMFEFFKTLPNNDGDILIIGRSGIEILQNLSYTQPYDLLIFERDLPKPSEIGVATQKLAPYKKINVYFPQLKTVATQTPTMVDLSQEIITQENDPNAVPEGGVAILEPEGPKMLEFFESQILGLLLEQSFLEAELSRTAQRFLTMDAAQQKAGEYIKQNELLLLKEENNIRGSQILETTLGYMARRNMG